MHYLESKHSIQWFEISRKPVKKRSKAKAHQPRQAEIDGFDFTIHVPLGSDQRLRRNQTKATTSAIAAINANTGATGKSVTLDEISESL